MRKPPSLPVDVAGPGSQPDDDALLRCLPMPALQPFAMPRPGTGHDSGSLAGAAAVVDALRHELAAWRAGQSGPPSSIDVGALPAGEREALNDGLGQGEVSVIVHRSAAQGSPPRTRIQETAFAGVWRTRHYDCAGELCADLLEAAAIPPCVPAGAREGSADGLETGALPDGAMNAGAVLGELAHHAAVWRTGDDPHVVNLTLLPCTAQDLQVIGQRLGAGAVAILARGFGNCRIASTRVRNVWRVQHFNNVQTLILDTIEVVDLPRIALAAPEDFEDSLPRLAELVRWMREDAADRAVGAAAKPAIEPAAGSAGHRRAGARFECGVCWQVYDPAAGDPVWQVPPGTPFSALPAHWSCPRCGTEKSRFMALADG